MAFVRFKLSGQADCRDGPSSRTGSRQTLEGCREARAYSGGWAEREAAFAAVRAGPQICNVGRGEPGELLTPAGSSRRLSVHAACHVAGSGWAPAADAVLRRPTIIPMPMAHSASTAGHSARIAKLRTIGRPLAST